MKNENSGRSSDILPNRRLFFTEQSATTNRLLSTGTHEGYRHSNINVFIVSPVSYPYLIAAASSSSSTTKPILLTYEDSKVIPAQAANGTNGKAAEPAGSTNEDAAAADHQLYQRWQEIRQLNRSAAGMAQEVVGFLLHEVVPAGAAACGRIENKE